MMSTSFKYSQVTKKKKKLVLSGCARFFKLLWALTFTIAPYWLGIVWDFAPAQCIEKLQTSISKRFHFCSFPFFRFPRNISGQNLQNITGCFGVLFWRLMGSDLREIHSYFTLVLGFPCCTSLTKKNWIQRCFNGKQKMARTCRVLPKRRELSYTKLFNSDLWGERIVPKCEFVKSIHSCYNYGDLWINLGNLL